MQRNFILKGIFICIILAILFILSFNSFNRPNLGTDFQETILNLKYRNDVIYNETILNKPWYMKNGTIQPFKNYKTTDIWPTSESSDLIFNQLMFIPKSYNRYPIMKKIYIYNPEAITYWNYVLGQQTFKDEKCPVNSCFITHNPSDASKADAVVFEFSANFESILERDLWKRSYDQVWILYTAESPPHTPDFKDLNNKINWTMTYRLDSDIPFPYGRWIYYNSSITHLPQNQVNYAAFKNKKVAWFVSNCNDKNNRLKYAEELSKYISVDIYGQCGNKICTRNYETECQYMLKLQYKFYLAFENSNCINYVTEKLFVNALHHKVLPIVMGARPQDYERLAPYKSYIHVDDFDSPKELADYLHKLDQNDNLYNEYFQWRGTGEFMLSNKFLCRICAMLHENNMPRKSYGDLNEWWRGDDKCIGANKWPKN